MMIPMLSGGIDLSIIATANLCALTVAYTLTTFMPEMQGHQGICYKLAHCCWALCCQRWWVC